jgi:hypothetical protein
MVWVVLLYEVWLKDWNGETALVALKITPGEFYIKERCGVLAICV